MIVKQYRLHLETADGRWAHPDWGYHLYAALLEDVSKTTGNRLHENERTPVSQFLHCEKKGKGQSLCWYVSLLGEKCQWEISHILEYRREYFLKKENVTLRVLDWKAEGVEDTDELFRLTEDMPRTHRIKVLTPAAFKVKGKYQPFPDIRLILQSLFRQWNAYVPQCPIEDADGEGLEAMANRLVCTEFAVFSRRYAMKQIGVTGFVGDLTLENRAQGFHRQLIDALLYFGSYTGIGIKTALGMGGMTEKALSLDRHKK